MTAADTLPTTDAAAFCAAEVRAGDFPRYATTLFVPPERRRAMLALYAFSIEVTRIRDLVSQPLPGEIRLQWWSDMLAGSGHGNVTDNPVAAELLDVIAGCGLPANRLADLIDAHRFDLYDEPMSTMMELERYCTITSGLLYELSAAILGHRSPAIAHLAQHAGIGHGMVSVLMRLPIHSSRRQLFLPEELLHEHSVSVADLFAGKATPELMAALDHFASEARAHLNSATKLLEATPKDIRPAFLQLPLLRRMLDRMMQPDQDPFRPEAPSRLSVLWRIWRASRTA